MRVIDESERMTLVVVAGVLTGVVTGAVTGAVFSVGVLVGAMLDDGVTNDVVVGAVSWKAWRGGKGNLDEVGEEFG